MDLINPSFSESEEEKRARQFEEYLDAQREPAPAPPPLEAPDFESEPAAAPPPPPTEQLAAQATPEKPVEPAKPKMWAEQYQDMYQEEKPNNKAMLWASLADLALNKGRNIGGIMAEHQKAKGGGGLDNAIKRARLNKLTKPRPLDEMAERRVRVQEQQLARMQEGDKRKVAQIDPSSDISKAVQDVVIKRGVPEAEARRLGAETLYKNFPAFRADIEHFYAPQEAQDAASKSAVTSAAGTGARLETEHAYAPQSAADAARQAGAVAAAGTGARIGTEAALADTSAQTAVTEQEAKAGAERQRMLGQAGYVYPGVIAEDPEAWAHANADKTTAAHIRTKVDTAQRGDKMLQEMEELLAGTGKAKRLIPGQRQTDYQNLRSRYIGVMSTDNNTGVINDKEYVRLDSQLPAWTPNLTDTAVGAVTGDNVALEKLKGAHAAHRQSADAGLTTAKARIDWDAAPQTAPAAAGKTNTAVKNPDGSWTVTDRKGSRQVPQISPVYLEKLKSSGWQVSGG